MKSACTYLVAFKGLPARYLSDWGAFREYTQEVSLTTNYPVEAPMWVVDTAEPMQNVLDALADQLVAQG